MDWSDRRPVVEAKAVRQDLGVGTAYLDPFEAAEAIGIVVVAAPLGKDAPIEGMYLRRQGRGFILVNASKPYRRQRLTCAHEIGHHILLGDGNDIGVIEGPEQVDSTAGPEEREAFNFASELLMPEQGVRAVAAKSADFESAVAAVVRQYDASPQSAAVRLSELALIDQVTCSTFMALMKDQNEWRAFVRRHDIKAHPKASAELRLPAPFTDKANRLFELGVLSHERHGELLDRDLAAVR